MKKLEVSYFDIANNNIPNDFNNYKIVHLSDLHFKEFGTSQNELISKIQSESPNLIVMTGDMIDKKQTNYQNTENLFKGISNIAPVYLVTGNHELYSSSIEKNMEDLYGKYNFICLNNESATITHGNSSINIYGLRYTDTNSKDSLIIELKKTLKPASTDTFSILLNHRSDLFDYVAHYNYSLVLSGHAHGGLIRLPLLGGLIANNKSLFPKYDGGLFKKNNSTLISSRGLGDSNVVPRINNNPEIIVITLKS